METEGTKIIIRYKNFSDKDLMYIVRLVNEEFNEELAGYLGAESFLEETQRLHAPLEIKEVKTGQSIVIDFIPNAELILAYIALRFGEDIVRDLSQVFRKGLKQILRNSLQKVVDERFPKRKRRDNLEYFSYQ